MLDRRKIVGGTWSKNAVTRIYRERGRWKKKVE
jgi:hypothetical protein